MAQFVSFLKYVLVIGVIVALAIAHPIIDDQVQLEAPEYQNSFMDQLKTKNTLFDDAESEFLNIKNQIAKQLFAEYDPAQLAIILNTIGCKDANCPVLIEISSIDFYITAVGHHAKRYIGTREKRNKQIIRTINATLINDSTEKQEFSSELQNWPVDQNFQVNISKTASIYANGTKEIPFTAAENIKFNFTQQSMETNNISQAFIAYAYPQKITLEPNTKLVVTFNFYQFELINDYFLDFDLDEAAVIKHPTVDANSNVVFGKSPLLTFILNHLEFVQNMTFTPAGIELVPFEGGAVLKNFPATETITNFAIDVEFGYPEPIDPITTTTSTTARTTKEIPAITTSTTTTSTATSTTVEIPAITTSTYSNSR